MKKIRETLAGMMVGDVVDFEAERYRTVAVTCSDYGFVTNRKYKITRDREQRKVYVRREE